MNIIIGYFAAICIGLALGLIGGGGSILTVPVLVYLFNVSPLEATSYSLFIVGITSLSGLWPRVKKNQIDKASIVFFGLSSLLTVFLIRNYVIPTLPKALKVFSLNIDTGTMLMVLFALLMLLAAFSMLFLKDIAAGKLKSTKVSPFYLLLYGVGSGLITGLLGAGGGFLIIPVLTFFCRLPMKTAIGTSLFIITINALMGFGTDLMNSNPDWKLLLTIGATAVAGMWLGNRWSDRFSGQQLKRGFGWFVLGMAIFLLFDNLLHH